MYIIPICNDGLQRDFRRDNSSMRKGKLPHTCGKIFSPTSKCRPMRTGDYYAR